jgi:hypothetical protein
MNHQE